jgi:hypothetical protein
MRLSSFARAAARSVLRFARTKICRQRRTTPLRMLCPKADGAPDALHPLLCCTEHSAAPKFAADPKWPSHFETQV